MADPPRTEIRLGLVLYGGVSLAIYMYGVVCELWRFALAGSQDGRQDPQENAYVELLQAADASATVDVIAGTSAGGINGILLGKALATGADLAAARELWLESGDLALLLQEPGEPLPQSLLRSEFFEAKLAEGLQRMGSGAHGVADVLDVFVSTTDLRGHKREFIDWLGQPIFTREYLRTFRLKRRCQHRLGGELVGFDQNDFAAGRDPQLVKLARATSAFPVAFEPMKIDDVPDGFGMESRMGWYSDGGILHNKPFAETISTIVTRTATTPVQRWLLSVDPDPERSDVAPVDPVQPDFLEVLRKSTGEIPRYQSVAADLDRLADHNARVRGLSRTVIELESRIEQLHTAGEDAAYLQVGYDAYGDLRRKTLAEDWGQRIVRRAGLDAPEAQATVPAGILRYLEAAGPDAPDTAFRLRRIYYLVKALGLPPSAPGEWTAPPDDHRDLLWLQFERIRQLLWDLFESPESTVAELGGLSEEQLFERVVSVVATVAAGLVNQLASIDESTRGACYQIQQARPDLARSRSAGGVLGQPLAEVFASFELRDMFLLPLQRLGELGEREEVRHVRISPAAAGYTGVPAGDKLAGETLGHFGGFLEERWRSNDMVWGRLDTAEVLVQIALPNATLAGRSAHIERLHRQILDQEHGHGWSLGDYRARLKREQVAGRETVAHLPGSRLTRLGLRAAEVFRNMLRTLEESQPGTGAGKLRRRAFGTIGRVLGIAIGVLRWPLVALFGETSLARRVALAAIILPFLWAIATTVVWLLGIVDGGARLGTFLALAAAPYLAFVALWAGVRAVRRGRARPARSSAGETP